MAAAADHVLVDGQLLGADRPARVQAISVIEEVLDEVAETVMLEPFQSRFLLITEAQ